MKRLLSLVFATFCIAHWAFSDEPVIKQFLRYKYGAEGIALTNICVPCDDVWMLKGKRDTNALAALETMTFPSNKRNGLVSDHVGLDMYFLELRDGKVDPAFSLDGIYMRHRNMVLRFVYACLTRDMPELRRITTDSSNVRIDGPPTAPPAGEMGQYQSIIEILPVVRSGKAADDAKTMTITYRVPISESGLAVTLCKEGNSWKVETSKPIQVPLGFFYR